MIIGIDIRTLMDKHYSGVSEYTLSLVNALLAIDKENEYILFYNSFKPVKHLPDFKQYKNVKIKASRYPNKLFNLGIKIFHRPRLDKLIGGVDVFLCPNLTFLSLSRDCKSVLVVHDLSFLKFKKFFSAKRNLWHRIVNIKKLITRFDSIVAISENTKKDILELCPGNEGKTSVIHSGVEQIICSDEDLRRVKEKYNLPEDFFLSLSTIEPRKNIEGIIKSYESFRGKNIDLRPKLVIAGKKGWKSGPVYLAWKKSDYRDDILFLGYVDSAYKPALYGAAKVFLYPSFYEGFGFPVLEAMRAGTPVVAGSVSSLPEIAAEAAILVDPFNIEALSQAMLNALVDEGLRRILIAKGRERAGLFTWEKTARNFLDFFSDLA